MLKCARDALRRTCPVVLLFPLLLRNALDRCSLASMHTSERQRSVAIKGVVHLRAYFLQSGKSEQPVIEVPLCSDHPQAPPNRVRAKGAQRTSSQREIRTPDTHKSKSPVRRRHIQNAPDQNPKEKQGLSFSTGASKPRGKSKKGARPPFWSPEGVGIPKGRGPCERSFPLGRVFDDFLHEQKVIRVRAGQARG